ncbi:MAG: ATP-binding domain-containing protein [Clostridiales bacterium]|nr:ATP-binding domain-containing protein [Clostridiales bacterium]
MVGEDNPQDEFWNGDSVAICNLFKARSNEAPMVYVIDAHTSFFSKFDAAKARNLLYSAMTRSKAWVRVSGFGKEMDSLVSEYERIKSKGFKLDFVYPTRHNVLRLVYREARDEPIVSDPLYLRKTLANTLESIRLGKVELDEDQYFRLKDWIERKEEYYNELRDRAEGCEEGSLEEDGGEDEGEGEGEGEDE